MLDIAFIRQNKEAVVKNCVDRRASVDINALLVLDEKRRASILEIETLRASKNKVSKGKPSPEEIIAMKEVGEVVKRKEAELAVLESEYQVLMGQVPNMTHPDSPIGEEADFIVRYTSKEPPTFDFEPKDHEAIMLEKDMIDFERGTKVAGAKWYFAKGQLVRLNQALLKYGMDILERHGFTLMETPDVAKADVLVGAGFIPRGPETQIYNIEGTDLSMIGTAEITVLGYHANEVLDLSKGPKKYAAISHCFRTEAGAYGRTSKGLYRVHQFTKLEMFAFCKPEESEAIHAEILSIEKEICDGLDLSYRVIDIPSADLGGPAYRKYDIEAYMTMKQDFGEVTSTSNCTDYQARRMNIKYRKDDGSLAYVHTLNGTALNTSRFPIAIIEQHQTEDGAVQFPSSLGLS